MDTGITLEHGISDGGFGQKVATTYYANKEMKVKTYGLKREFYDRYHPAELFKQLGMTTKQILNDFEKIIEGYFQI